MDTATRADLLARITKAQSVGATILSNMTAAKRLVEAEQPIDPPPPPVPATILGACPLTGGMTTAAAARVIDRWGKGAAVRLFSSGGFSTIAPALPDAGRILASWKPALGVPLDRAAVLAALAPLPAGSKVAVWHEPDVKARKGEDPAPMIALHREFAAIVRADRPDLVLMGVLSGWTFTPTKTFRPEDYIDPAAFDVLALDLDGITDAYADFLPSVAKAHAWMADVGITRWTVAEFGAPRLATDTTGATRAAWITEQVTALLALPNPPEDICLFESTAYAGTELTATVEQDAWRALV